MIVQEQLKKTPLFSQHINHKARMVPFGGWEMPVQYEGILAEYQHTRDAVTLFDTSHMGEFLIEGDCVKSGLDNIITSSIKDMPLNTCRYGLMLNEHGGVIDDLIVFRLEQEKWFIVVNGATTEKDKNHFLKHLTKQARFKDISLETGKIDVQGPLSREVLSQIISGLDKLNYYTFDYFNVLGEKVIVSRTGYTGELGYEVYYPWGKTEMLWQKLLSFPKVKPAGLGARDTLRLEMGYSLYGHELTENTSPLQAGLERFIDFEKDFIAKEELLKEKASGIKRKVVGLISDNRRSAREGHKIYSFEEQEIGIVSSGTFSPYLNRGIGLAFIDSLCAKIGEKIYFGDVSSRNSAVISQRSFYKKGSLKN